MWKPWNRNGGRRDASALPRGAGHQGHHDLQNQHLRPDAEIEHVKVQELAGPTRERVGGRDRKRRGDQQSQETKAQDEHDVHAHDLTRARSHCLHHPDLLDVLAEDHVRTARAKGLSERSVLLSHAMRNAWPPILTIIGLQMGSLFSGAILTETIFSWPGMGQLIVDRVLARDYPVVQGVVLVAALLFVLINLATDICYTCLDPRIRYE